MVISNASAQHAAVNNAQAPCSRSSHVLLPNAPVGLQRPPPACRGRCSERSRLDTFPDVNSTVHVTDSITNLNFITVPLRFLSGSAEQHFTDSIPLEMAARFHSDLRRLSCDIRARNIDLKLPYVYLDPATVEDSVRR
uniref:Lipoxygenase domain-containing protein n=1 Tax=Seriola dumerili TaxID=41447 RepID=A0A3B4TBB3_SERDU